MKKPTWSSERLAKLRDPRWQKMRLEIMQRDEFACRICYSKERTLNVHHITYESVDPWDEEPYRLVTLCEDCHGVVKHCTTEGQRASFSLILMAANVYHITPSPQFA